MEEYSVEINELGINRVFRSYLLRYVNYHPLRASFNCKIINDFIDYCDITIVWKGKFDYIINDRPIQVNSGEMLYIPPGSRRVRLVPDCDVEYLSLNFWYLPENNIPVINDRDSFTLPEKAVKAARMICDVVSKKELNLEKKSTPLLALLITYLEEEGGMLYTNEIVDHVKHEIREHWNENLTVAAIAKNMNYSTEHICRLFKLNEKRTVTEYISSIRLNHVSDMLLYSKMSIQDIAMMCGLSVFYFCRWFRANTGMSPGEYRTAYHVKRTP